MKVSAFVILLIFAGLNLNGENGHNLWLRNKSTGNVNVVCAKSSPTLSISIQELKNGWQGKPNATIVLTIKNDKAIKKDGFKLSPTGIQANTEIGILYGVYQLLRQQQTGQPVLEMIFNPSYEVRTLDHWDNPDGSIERGYAGRSIFWRNGREFSCCY